MVRDEEVEPALELAAMSATLSARTHDAANSNASGDPSTRPQIVSMPARSSSVTTKPGRTRPGAVLEQPHRVEAARLGQADATSLRVRQAFQRVAAFALEREAGP
jgi:hypothetical protein